MKKEKWDDIFCWLTLGLIPVHIYLSFVNIIYGIDKGYGRSYPARSYVLIALYLLVIAVALVYMACQRKFGIARGWKIYWLSAGVAAMVAILIEKFMCVLNGVALFALFYTPCMAWLPLWDIVGVPGKHILPVTAAFCFLCWGVCQLFVKTEK